MISGRAAAPAVSTLRHEAGDGVAQIVAIGEPERIGAGEDLEAGPGKMTLEVAGMADVDPEAAPAVEDQRGDANRS